MWSLCTGMQTRSTAGVLWWNVTFNPKGSSLLRLSHPHNSFYIGVGALWKVSGPEKRRWWWLSCMANRWRWGFASQTNINNLSLLETILWSGCPFLWPSVEMVINRWNYILINCHQTHFRAAFLPPTHLFARELIYREQHSQHPIQINLPLQIVRWMLFLFVKTTKFDGHIFHREEISCLLSFSHSPFLFVGWCHLSNGYIRFVYSSALCSRVSLMSRVPDGHWNETIVLQRVQFMN